MTSLGLTQAIATLALLVEFGGGVVIAWGCLRAIGALAVGLGRSASITHARLLIADAVIAALGFKTAATLLKTMELRTWNAIAVFAAILAIRPVVKRVLNWERARLQEAGSR